MKDRSYVISTSSEIFLHKSKECHINFWPKIERLERDRKNFTKKGKSDLDQNICYIYLPDVQVLDFSTCYYELSFNNKSCCGYSQNLFATSNTNLRFRLDSIHNYILFIA